MSLPQSTLAVHRADLAVDPATKLLGKVDKGGSTILFLARLLVGGLSLLVSVASLVNHHWMCRAD